MRHKIMSKLEQVVHPLSKNGNDNKNSCQNHFMCTFIQNWKGQASDNFVMAN